jgi:hypothetical protein
MNAIALENEAVTPAAAVESLVARHGFRPVLLALFGQALGRRKSRRRAPPLVLNDHLRRDIGLEPEPFHRDPWGLG